MNSQFPHISCPHCSHSGPDSGHIVRNGFFYRRNTSKFIQRFRCRLCGHSFSLATSDPCFRQHKRTVNVRVKDLLCSGVSLRRIARILHLNQKTVVRKLYFLAKQANAEINKYRNSIGDGSILDMQFDEMETIEHTKCKPLSIALAVTTEKRKILAMEVSQMSCKGPLTPISLKKYGYRTDKRAKGIKNMLQTIKPLLHPNAVLTSDKCGRYTTPVKKYLPKTITHRTVKGRKSSTGGQGEIKKIRFDPIFSLNHTCAMLRANVNRLIRKTWCTTKKPEALKAHLAIYMNYHNQVLTPA